MLFDCAVLLDEGAEVIAQSRAVRAKARAARERWAVLADQILEALGEPRIHGASDGEAATDVAAAISGVALCTACIASKTGMTIAELDDTMRSLRRALDVGLSLAPCEGCRRDTLLYRID